jgi:hypothetical protein
MNTIPHGDRHFSSLPLQSHRGTAAPLNPKENHLSSPKHKHSLLILSKKYLTSRFNWMMQKTMGVQPFLKKVKWILSIFITSTLLCLGPIHSLPLPNSPSSSSFLAVPHAHASSVITANSRNDNHAKSHDMLQIIEQYIQRHMFQDEMYDPVESTYREIIHDSLGSTPKQYTKTLSSTIASVLGKKNVPISLSSSSGSLGAGAGASDGHAIKFVLKLVDSLEEKTGLSRSVIVPALFLVGGGVPVVIVLAGLMSFSYSQKAMTERMAIERYGESVLEAEEIVVRDEDEDEDEDEGGDDEEDEEEEDDEEDDEDEEDDDNQGKNNVKKKRG